jgi:subtilisin-like proprotein convertase family protein
MKQKICVLSLAALFIALTVRGADFSTILNATIPDGDLNGYQNSQTLSGLPGPIIDVNISLNISVGFNGDLYAFLSHGSGMAVLLNRVGRTSASNFGYPDAGFGPDATLTQFTLDDQAAHDVHLYRTFAYTLNTGELTGQWQPDGRNIDPLSPGSTFDAAARSNGLGVFDGMDPNGPWTLFVADVSPGGESTLVGWGLQITAVPEPSTASLVCCGIAGVVLWGFRRRFV